MWEGGQIELRRGSGRKAAHLVVELVHLLPSCLEQVGNVGLALLRRWRGERRDPSVSVFVCLSLSSRRRAGARPG